MDIIQYLTPIKPKLAIYRNGVWLEYYKGDIIITNGDNAKVLKTYGFTEIKPKLYKTLQEAYENRLQT